MFPAVSSKPTPFQVFSPPDCGCVNRTIRHTAHPVPPGIVFESLLQFCVKDKQPFVWVASFSFPRQAVTEREGIASSAKCQVSFLNVHVVRDRLDRCRLPTL